MEDRVKKLETITQRLMRRAGKRAVALITPYPISNAVFGDALKGTIFRYMFPCEGVITVGVLRLGEKPKKRVIVNILLFNETGSSSKGFSVEKKIMTVQPNIKVVAGDCLEVSLDPLDEVVTEVWVSLLWRPTIKNTEVKSFLIEELEDDLSKRSLITEQPSV